jgi:hypothetical protein
VQVYRSEIVTIRADAGPINGQFRGTATLAKPGIYTYSDGVETWREWTPPETLTDAVYIDSLKMLPVTLNHPSPPVVTAANAKALAVGAIGDTITTADDGMLSAPIAVWDAAAATAAQTTHKQISLGYGAIVDMRPGTTPDGQKYDRKQVARMGNHVALVEEGRHGPRVRVRADGSADVSEQHQYAERVDSRDATSPPLDNLTDRSDTKPERKMATIKLGNLTVEVADAATASTIQTHVDSLSGQITAALTEKTRADSAAGELAAATAQIETLKTDHAAALEVVKADAMKAARGRVALENKVAGICGAEWKADGKTDRDCRLDALKVLKVEVAADASDEYIAGALDFASKAKADAPRLTTADVIAAGMNRADNKTGGAVRMTADNLNWE